MPLTSAREGAVGTIREGALSPHYYESLDESIAQQAAKAASTFSCSSLWADFRDAVQTDLWPYIFHVSCAALVSHAVQRFLS